MTKFENVVNCGCEQNKRCKMAIKKRNDRSINFSDKAIILLQELGFLDGRKKNRKERSLSEYISRLVCLDNEGKFMKKWLVYEMNEVTDKRNELDNKISDLARSIGRIKE